MGTKETYFYSKRDLCLGIVLVLVLGIVRGENVSKSKSGERKREREEKRAIEGKRDGGGVVTKYRNREAERDRGTDNGI